MLFVFDVEERNGLDGDAEIRVIEIGQGQEELLEEHLFQDHVLSLIEKVRVVEKPNDLVSVRDLKQISSTHLYNGLWIQFQPKNDFFVALSQVVATHASLCGAFAKQLHYFEVKFQRGYKNQVSGVREGASDIGEIVAGSRNDFGLHYPDRSVLAEGLDVFAVIDQRNVPNDEVLSVLFEHDIHLNDIVLEVIDLLPVLPNGRVDIEAQNIHLEGGVGGQLLHLQMRVLLNWRSVYFAHNEARQSEVALDELVIVAVNGVLVAVWAEDLVFLFAVGFGGADERVFEEDFVEGKVQVEVHLLFSLEVFVVDRKKQSHFQVSLDWDV